jgi:hypothetical protein
MNDLQKRAIAKIAYMEMYEVIKKWSALNEYGYIPISFLWDGKITVDGREFLEFEMRDYE